jgi:hypothetical protein
VVAEQSDAEPVEINPAFAVDASVSAASMSTPTRTRPILSAETAATVASSLNLIPLSSPGAVLHHPSGGFSLSASLA